MGRSLGRGYTLDEVIGRGDTGEVWRGRTTEGGAPYAVKILHETVPGDPGTAAGLLRAGAVLMDVAHPHVVRVRDLVTEWPVRAIVMDLVEGRDLRAHLAELRTLPPAEACRVGAEAAAGLAAIHRARIAHGAVRPQNILLDDGTEPPAVRLTDFGTDHLTGRADRPPRLIESAFPYAAPELAQGGTASPPADLYALGIVLYEMCCGVTPFADVSALAVLRGHAERPPGRPPDVPDRLWEFIAALLAKDPAKRPGPASRVSDRLTALARGLGDVPAAPALTVPPPAEPADGIGPAGSVGTAGMAGPARPVRRGPRHHGVLIAAGCVLLAMLMLTVGYVAIRPASDRTGLPGPEPEPSAGAPGGSQPGSAGSDGSAGGGSKRTAGSATPTVSYGPGRMPDLRGLEERAARSRLPPRVIVQTVRSRPPGGVSDRVVLTQEPRPGVPLPQLIKITVSSRENTRHLAELQPTSSRYEAGMGNMTLAGLTQPHALSVKGGPCGDEAGWAEYDLGKDYTRLTGLAGIDDGSAASGIGAVIEISGDGRRLMRATVSLGRPSPIDLDLTDLLRLTLRWRFLLTSRLCDSRNEGALLFGDAQLFTRPGQEPPSPTPILTPSRL